MKIDKAAIDRQFTESKEHQAIVINHLLVQRSFVLVRFSHSFLKSAFLQLHSCVEPSTLGWPKNVIDLRDRKGTLTNLHGGVQILYQIKDVF